VVKQQTALTTVQHGGVLLVIRESTEDAVHVLLHSLRYYRILPYKYKGINRKTMEGMIE